MNYLYPFFPDFLKRLDKYLLLNKPVVWATQVHSFTFLGLVWLLVGIAISCLVPLSTPSTQQLLFFKIVLSIPSVALVFLWAYHQDLHKIESSFGRMKPSYNRTQFFAYIWILMLLTLPLLVSHSILVYRDSTINVKGSLLELWATTITVVIFIAFIIHLLRQIGWRYLLLTLAVHLLVGIFILLFKNATHLSVSVSMLWLAGVGIASYESNFAVRKGKSPKWYYVVAIISGQLGFTAWGTVCLFCMVFLTYQSSTNLHNIIYFLCLLAIFIGYIIIPQFSRVYLGLIANPKES